MSLTGQALASSNAPAYRLGIRTASPDLLEPSDELARTIGHAWAERTIPVQAYEDLATAIALLVIREDMDLSGYPTALEIQEGAERRVADGVLEDLKPAWRRAIGYDAADEAEAHLLETGRELWTALGERRIPLDALGLLSAVISRVADAGSPARDLYPGGLQ